MATSNTSEDRVTALGNQMVQVHIWLLDTLDQVRADFAAHSQGIGPPPRELTNHCMAFCSALERHHSGEDRSVFPALARKSPELRPLLEELERDHRFIAEILRRLNELIDTFGSTGARDSIQIRQTHHEIEGLAAILESHLRFEEKKIVDSLNEISASELDIRDFLVVSRAAP